jgi:hypothetical protein
MRLFIILCLLVGIIFNFSWEVGSLSTLIMSRTPSTPVYLSLGRTTNFVRKDLWTTEIVALELYNIMPPKQCFGLSDLLFILCKLQLAGRAVIEITNNSVAFWGTAHTPVLYLDLPLAKSGYHQILLSKWKFGDLKTNRTICWLPT